jgi:hypothetical protein
VSTLKEYGRYSTVGLEMIVWFALGGYAGHRLDQHFGTQHWMAAGFGFGVFAGFYSLWKTVRKAQHEMVREEERDKERRLRGEGGDGGEGS